MSQSDDPPAPAQQVSLFADESGFTGRNIFDATQPLHVEVGLWLTPQAEAEVIEKLNSHAATLPSSFGEFSGMKLLKSAPGRRFLATLIEVLVTKGAIASIVAMHKPFMAAGVIVEDYTDHVDNPAFGPEWTWNLPEKQFLAEKILRTVPEDTLAEWWRARNKGMFAEFQAAHGRLMGAMRLLPQLSEFAVRADRANIQAIHEDEKQVEVKYSPSFNGFTALLEKGHLFAKRRGWRDVPVVHDEQSEMEPQFRRFFDLWRNASPVSIPLGNGETRELPIDSFASLSFGRSAEDRRLQAIDCIAAVARRTIEAATFGAEGSVLQQVLSVEWERLITHDHNELPIVVGPLSWQGPALSALLRQ